MAPKYQKPSDERLVYSSEEGRICPECGKSLSSCRCKGAKKKPVQQSKQPNVPNDGVVRVRPEKKGRGGKVATTVTGLRLNDDELRALAKTLKKKCGVGGSVKERVIILQGDYVDEVVDLLKGMGHDAKRAGG